MTVATSKVQGRRTLRFETVDDILAEVDRLSQARNIKTLGNWTAGQVCNHLALVMKGAMDGSRFKIPFPMNLVMPVFVWLRKKKMLSNPMPAGFQLPKAAAQEIVSEPVSTEEGLEALRTTLLRFKTDRKRAPSPVFGELTHDEWTQLQCRHCELHLSFLIPEPA